MNKFLAVCALALVLLVVEYPPTCNGQRLVGGVSNEQYATPRISNLVRALGPQISQKLMSRNDGQPFQPNSPLVAISYRSQLVNGMIYYIKIQTQLGRQIVYYHVKVYQDFNGDMGVLRIQGPMQNEERITSF